MKPIPQQIASLISDAIQAAQKANALPEFELPTEIPVTPAKNPELGDYASPIAMATAKAARRKPLDIATAIAEHLPETDLLESAEATPPGFINMRLSQTWLREQVENIIETGEALYSLEMGKGKTAQVEFVSANPTGPLTIGRTRGAILGDSLARLLEACGWAVQREYYFNNAGRQMEMLGKSLRARYLEALGQTHELPEDGYQGDYLKDVAEKLKEQVGDSWQDKDWPDFKEHAEVEIFAMIKATLKRIEITHDNFFAEQSVYEDNTVWDVLEKLRAAGHVYEDTVREDASEEDRAEAAAKNYKPATWFRSTTFGDTEDRVLVKSNQDPTYVLPDIAYHVNKLERGFDRAYNILGADHAVEAQTVSRALTALGYDAERVHALLHQFVTFGDQRMSTRKGVYVLLDELLDDVGADVTRYFMLARSHNSHIDFDLDLAREQSKENPVYYIQNAHVRCCGIFRQVEERGYAQDWDTGADLSLLGDTELQFVRKMLELLEVLQMAHDKLEPHQVAFYAIDLARQFHPMYDEVRVLHSDVSEDLARARLRFYRATQITFACVLKLMGMSAPETM